MERVIEEDLARTEFHAVMNGLPIEMTIGRLGQQIVISLVTEGRVEGQITIELMEALGMCMQVLELGKIATEALEARMRAYFAKSGRAWPGSPS
jgi:hypothetical protein